MIRRLVALAFVLSMTLGLTPAFGADASAVKVVVDRQAWLNVPITKTWTSTQTSQAKKVIGLRAEAVNIALATLRKKGATTVRVQPKFLDLRRDLHTEHPQYAKVAKQFSLVGFAASGKQVGVSEVFPKNVDNLGDYLLRIPYSQCTLTTSKTLNKCKVSLPSPESYLQGVLVSYVYKAGRGSFPDVQSQLELISTKRSAYTVKKGLLHCDCFEAELLERTLPLTGKKLGVDYKIKIGADRFSFSLTEKIDIDSLRRHVAIKKDDGGEWLMTPWGYFWK
jgi:hypothetical protein